jgi:LPXTG-motif cell wall-anchored protein
MSEKDANSFDDMKEDFPFDDFEEETHSTDDVELEDSSGSGPGGRRRNFWVTIGILAGVFVVVIVVLALVWIFAPSPNEARLDESALIYAHNTATAQAAIDIAYQFTQDAMSTSTPLPTNTSLPPTNTPVVVVATSTTDPLAGTEVAALGGPLTQQEQDRTATVAALLTQAAQGGTPVSTSEAASTLTGPTSTALPETGIADQMGFPGLVGLAVALLVVVILVRRFRHVNS